MPFITTPPETLEIPNNKKSYFGEVKEANGLVEEQNSEPSIRSVSSIETWSCNFPFSRVDGSINETSSTVRLSITQDERLSTLCEEYGLTVSTVMKVAWSLTLRAYTGNERVCFGYKSTVENPYTFMVDIRDFQTPVELMSWVQQSHERRNTLPSNTDLETGDTNTMLSITDEHGHGDGLIRTDAGGIDFDKVRETLYICLGIANTDEDKRFPYP